MAVTDQNPIGGAVGNGVTTVFPFSYYIGDEADLVVQRDGVNATLNVDYVVSGAGNPSGGQIAFVTAPANGVKVTHFRNTSLTRATDYQDGGDLPARTVNMDFDRLWLALQEIFSGGKGAPTAIRVPPGETVPALPAASERALMTLIFDAAGNPSVSVPISGSAADVLVQLANTSDTTKGDKLIGVKQPLTNAVSRTQHEKNAEIVSVRDFGAVGGGVTDDTAAFQLALNSGRAVYVPAVAGGYLTEELTFTLDNQCLYGDGEGSVINYKPGLAGTHLNTNGHAVTIRDLRLFGGDDSGKTGLVLVGARHGLKLDFDTNTTINNVTVHGYTGRGISPRNAVANRAGGTVLHSVKSYNNWSGIECGPTVAEYIRLGLITINGCRYGLVVSSGNVTGAVGCVNDNDTNLWLYGTDPAVPNDGHGNLTGFLFNHAVSYAVYAEDIRFGFNLDGNQFFYGNIYLKNCKGISICNSEMQIAGAQFEGGGRNYVCDNRLYTAAGLPNTFTHNYNALADDTICTGNVQVEDAASPSNPAILYQSDTRQIIGRSAGVGDAPFLHFGETGLPDTYGLTWVSNGATGVFKLLALNASVLASNPTLQIDRATGKITAGLVSLSNYANDAAAAAGGIPVGGLYRNGSVVMTRVV